MGVKIKIKYNYIIQLYLEDAWYRYVIIMINKEEITINTTSFQSVKYSVFFPTFKIFTSLRNLKKHPLHPISNRWKCYFLKLGAYLDELNTNCPDLIKHKKYHISINLISHNLKL